MALLPDVKNLLENEAEIVERAKTDDKAFAVLYNHYFPKIYGYIFKRVGNHQIAEDLVSQTFLKVFTNLKNYEFQGYSFSCWLYQIATNNLIDHYRQSGRRPQTNLEVAEELADERNDIVSQVSARQDQELFSELIGQLPQRFQEVIHLRYFAELSYEEMSVQLELTENNCRVMVHRALKSFQEIYKKYGK